MWRVVPVALLCVLVVGESWSAPAAKRKPASRGKQKKFTNKKKFLLPRIPLLRMKKRGGEGKLPIFRRSAIRGIKARKQQAIGRRGRRKGRRLPTRPPEQVRRIPIRTPKVRAGSPVFLARRRQNVIVKRLPSNKAGLPLVHWVVHRHSLGRRGSLLKWRGHIVLLQDKVYYRCLLRSFCKTLQRQVLRLMRGGLRYQGKVLSPRDKKFHWALRRALERQHGYAIVSKTK